jgi:hypothetical protein
MSKSKPSAKEQARRSATAYHEAGHAFADWHFKFRVKRASIVPDAKAGSAGRVESEFRSLARALNDCTVDRSVALISRAHTHIIALLAGEAAQRRYRPSSVRRWHASGDYQQAVDWLVSLHPQNELPHVVRYLQASAKNLVEKPMHWAAIRYLAGELLKRQTMTGKEVNKAILVGFQMDSDA